MSVFSQEYKYFAFISYKHEDKKWDRWLQNRQFFILISKFYSLIFGIISAYKPQSI